jgi:hypothetical protein
MLVVVDVVVVVVICCYCCHDDKRRKKRFYYIFEIGGSEFIYKMKISTDIFFLTSYRSLPSASFSAALS